MQHSPARRVSGFTLVLPLALAATAACDSSPTQSIETAAEIEAAYRPELAQFSVTTLPWEFALVVASTATDEPLLAEGEYLTVQVTSSAGDAETLRLRRAVQAEGFEARWLTVTPKSDAPFYTFTPDIHSAGGMPVDFRLIYATDDADAFARRLRAYPWVASVEQRPLDPCTTVECVTLRATALDGGLVPTRDAPVPGDGRLSIVAPVTLTFSYTATSGAVYTVTREFAGPVPTAP